MPSLNGTRSPVTGSSSQDDELQRYRDEGTARALALDNRGPVRFDSAGKLADDIVRAYSQYGFYVFEQVLDADELTDLERDVTELIERAPTCPGGKFDRAGRAALGADCKGRNVTMIKPLTDLYGGTNRNNGRHPTKMAEPLVPADAPDYVLQLLLGPLQHSTAHLRLYGHPQMLAVAAAINGKDFTPFNEAIWVKLPRLGGSVSWHQDGWTHWDSPGLNEDTHGFNFMAQLYGCDAANGLWVVPGTHRNGKANIKALAEAAGSDRLADAVPLICKPGDIVMCNRQVVHGSFANTSSQIRVTLNFGFHRRDSVLNVRSGGIHNPVSLYDEAYIRSRSRLIAYAIDARRQRFPQEQSYVYEPLASEREQFRWTPEVQKSLHDYNLQDLGI